MNKSKKFRIKNLIKKLYFYTEVLEEIPKIKDLVKPLRIGIKKTYIKDSVYDVKEEIVKILKEIDGKIIVMIDDIDRLTANEIRELFTIIRAIADFPNTVYILAFDNEVVIKALEKVQEGNGKEYLEKIVQVPIELPLIDEYTVRRIFGEELKKIIVDFPKDLFDPDYWYGVFTDGIAPFIDTIINVKRLLNALRITYPSVKGEVNIVDFIAIETLRVFCPEVYTIIKNNPDMFCENKWVISSRILPNLSDSLKQFHHNWIANLNYSETIKESIKKLLKRLFPKVRSAFENYTYSWSQNWEREYRICIKDFFPRYFAFSIPSDDLSKNEIEKILATLSSKDAFVNSLKSLAEQKRPEGSTKLRIFLERMETYLPEIQISDIPTIIETFFYIGDKLIIPEDTIIFVGNDISIRMVRIIGQLLLKYDSKDKRFEILKEAFEKGKAIYMMVKALVAFWQQHGRYGGSIEPDENRLLNDVHLEKLKNTTLNKIREAARDNSLLNIPYFTFVLYYWGEWENKDEPKNWISNKVITSDELLLRFLSYLSNYLKPIKNIELQKDLERFVDLNILKNRCSELLSKNLDLNDELKLIINQILGLNN